MMKNSILTIGLLVLLLNTLNARENPFIAVENKATQQPQMKLIGDPIEKPKAKLVVTEKTIKEVSPKSDLVLLKKIVEEVLKDNKAIEEKKASIVKKKAIQKKKIRKKVVEIINPIKSLKINIKKNTFTIKTKYKLKDYFILTDEKKIVIDFTADINFYTYNHNVKLLSTFKKVTLGNHPENSYFRVVIITKDLASNYKLNIKENGLIVINRK